MFRSGRRSLVTVVAVAAFGLSAVPLFSADNGSVAATITVASPPTACLQLSGAAINFGTLAFSTTAAEVTASNAAIQAVNCGTQTESILASGTNATAASGGVMPPSWGLGIGAPNPCNVGVNAFRMSSGLGTGPAFGLTSQSPTTLGTIVAGPAAGKQVVQGVTMPCQGSDGAGQTMSFTYNYTATL